MSDYDFLWEMRDRGYSNEEIMEAAACGYAPYEAIYLDDDRNTQIIDDLFDDIKKLISDGLPTFGTCAGLILLAKKIENDDRVHLGLMDIKVKRNAYGRQLGSFFTENEFKHVGKVPMTFIRAPYITGAGENVEILSTVDGNIVAARENNILVTSYHPELNDDLRVHKFFVDMCKKAASK